MIRIAELQNRRMLLRPLLKALLGGMLLGSMLSSAQATPLDTAKMKTLSGTSGLYVFPAGSPYVLDLSPTDDASTIINNRINALSRVTGADTASKGGTIFIRATTGTINLTKTIVIQGAGIQLVGIRGDTTSGPQTGNYPTFVYNKALIDSGYDSRSSHPNARCLQNPAVIRVNGTDYDHIGDSANGDPATDKYAGIYGIKILYSATGSGYGDSATGITMHCPDFGKFRDITITNARNGIDVDGCTHPRFRNITITGVNGEFGFRCGVNPLLSNPFKIHQLTITAQAGNNTVELLQIMSNIEVVGAKLTNGKVGVDITSPVWDDPANDVCLRSVLIQHTAQQGILLNNAQQVYIMDTEVDYAGCESLKVLGGWDTSLLRPTGFYACLQLANFRSNHAGYSAIRVQSGMNLDIVNAELLNSGQNLSSAPGSDTPIAGIYLDSNVASLNLTGARIGTSDSPTTNVESYGIYVNTQPPFSSDFPWHPRKILASNINFFNALTPSSDTSVVTVTKNMGYNTLNDAGYFNPPPSESWTNQDLPGDGTSSDAWFDQVKGFNHYDLPEIKNQQWIDLTKVTSAAIGGAPTTNVVTGTAPLLTINADAFTKLEDWVCNSTKGTDYFPNGVVFYLPAGSLSGTTWTRNLYKLTAPLVINHPKIQLMGDGPDVTQLTITNTSNNHALPPYDNSVKIVKQNSTLNPTDSGVFGLSIYADLNLAEPAGGAFGSATTYAPIFSVSGAQTVRLSNLGTQYAMGGSVSIADSHNIELFDVNMVNSASNGSQPTVPLGGITISGSTTGATSDIRLFQVFGGFLANFWVSPGQWCPDNVANGMAAASIPEFTWIRILDHVSYVRIDYSTFIQGKDGLETATTSPANGIPLNIATCRFSTDHVYYRGFHLANCHNADFYGNWIGGRLAGSGVFEPGILGNYRVFNSEARGAGLESYTVKGGDSVAIVNYTGGICYYPWSNVVKENRPAGGVYFGNEGGSAAMVGGTSGWLFNSDETQRHVNKNTQDWGIVLSPNMTNYVQYNVDVTGNGGPNALHPDTNTVTNRGLARQTTAGSTNATPLFLAPATNSESANYP